MIVRKAQVDVLAAAQLAAFENRTLEHLKAYFPYHLELVGEAPVRLAVRHGLKQSAAYGFTAECCVRCYIETMLQLGSGFDTDILLPWAAEILEDTSAPDQVARGDRLYDKKYEYLRHAARDYRDPEGRPTTSRFMDDLRQIRHGSNDIVTPEAGPALAESLRSLLLRLFPAKCGYVGDDNLRQAIAGAIRCAGVYGITIERGVTLFTAMRFILGGSFDSDVLLPWIPAILRDPEIPDQYKRTDKFYAGAVGFLRRWWDVAKEPGDLRHVLE